MTKITNAALADEESIRGMLRTLIRNGVDPADAARRVMRLVVRPKFHESAADLFFPHLMVCASRIAREEVRSIERAVMRSATGDGGVVVPIAPLVREELADKFFALPDGRMVRWTLATADEHRERAAWQRRLAGAIIDDAAMHERAAAEIDAAGVTCIAEIEEAAA